jgi:predicted RNase H-like HicB family nuclease
MTETVLVTTPLRVTFVIQRDPSGLYVGHLREFPGIISQGRSPASLRRNLIRVLRQVSREHPEDLPLFR